MKHKTALKTENGSVARQLAERRKAQDRIGHITLEQLASIAFLMGSRLRIKLVPKAHAKSGVIKVKNPKAGT